MKIKYFPTLTRLHAYTLTLLYAGTLALWHSGTLCHAVDFEDLHAGARIGGMGNSYVATANDSQSLFLNPAGLSKINEDVLGSGIGHYYTEPIANYHLSYAHPLFEGVVVASGWQGTHALNKSLDRFYFSWAQKDQSPFELLSNSEFSWGMSLRTLSLRKRERVEQNFKTSLGLGFDIGTLLWFPALQSGLGSSLIGLDSTNLNLKGPFFSLGLQHRVRSLKLMLDFRARQGFSTFYPAAELSLLQEFLQVRMGRGANFGLLSTIALGLGINLRPLVVDVALQWAPEGLHRREGAAMLSVSYYFGSQRFYQNFIGKAAEEAKVLSQEIDSLEIQKNNARREISSLDINLRTLREEVRVLESRKREEAALTELQKLEEAKPRLQEQERLLKLQGPQWPKHHRVTPGDTLRKISSQYYGDPELWEVIYKANPDKVLRGLPKIGEVLMIPKPE